MTKISQFYYVNNNNNKTNSNLSFSIHFTFRIYDMDNDGFVSNGELFQVLKMMVGNNLKDTQLQQIVDKTIILYDKVD